jgi:hypothetical protein
MLRWSDSRGTQLHGVVYGRPRPNCGMQRTAPRAAANYYILNTVITFEEAVGAVALNSSGKSKPSKKAKS